MEIEKAFSKMEGQCADVVREIIDSRRLPDGDGFVVLMNFVAYAAARVPIKRATISAAIDKIAKQVMHLGFLGPDGAKLLRQLGEDGTEEDVKQLQAFIASDEYTVNLEQNWHVGMIIEAVDVLLPAMAHRNWGLWFAGDGVPDLVCSDNPVAFFATKPHSPLIPMGLGTPNTLLTVPLNRRTLLVSQLDEALKDSYVMDSDDVALMNTLRANNGVQIYSAEEHRI